MMITMIVDSRQELPFFTRKMIQKFKDSDTVTGMQTFEEISSL